MEQPTDQPTQALAKSGGDGQIIRSPREYTARLQAWQREHYHVLTPFANFSALPGHLGIVPTLVQLDNDPKGPAGEVYQDNVFTRGNDVAIAKIGLSKIAQAAGMSIRTARTDPRTIPNYWEVKATVRFIGIDGTPQEVEGMEEFDLRDGSERAKQMQPKQLAQARIKGLRQCESRAINAAIRQYGIKQKYTRDELMKPFVVLRLVYMPDMSNELTRARVEQQALAGTTALYGGSHALPPARHEDLGSIGVTDPVAAARVIDMPAKAPEKQARTIESVEHDLGTDAYAIRLDGGEILTTTPELAKQLNAAWKSKQRITINSNDETGELTSFDVAKDPAPQPAEAETSPAENGVVVATVKDAVEVSTGSNKNGTWRLRKIITDAGDWFTFSDTHLATAQQAKAKGWSVRLVRAEENPKYPDQLDIESITLIDPSQPNLPGVGKEY